MMRAIALDNEESALEIIDAFCNQLDSIDLCQRFTRTIKARDYLATHSIDLLISDINMPTQTGIDFYRSIDSLAPSQKPLVIFTTAYSAYAVESYEVAAVDYLLKPFSFERFSQAVQKAADYHRLLIPSVGESSKSEYAPYLFLRVEYSIVKVAVADILFIKGLDNYLKIHLVSQRPIVVRLTMKAMLEQLSPAEFIRVHKSYIVALHKVESVRHKLIRMGEEEIPISSLYEESFFRRFSKSPNG
ncbi:LytR/AlgR family response regulator transcription factor [Spirosoma pollinicola]|uniref:DNA-binding response regulator n=1 Tax=Spirosoma pollinicola TaxID=2057025 RepID=A0A2K8Z8F5_9BACT|nr:LytTR family DNA-binding domain-containing protein [Spirosoma pollinicola]AUD06109.1 DNA-binding response regulator [Spirosoma pollinicola]